MGWVRFIRSDKPGHPKGYTPRSGARPAFGRPSGRTALALALGFVAASAAAEVKMPAIFGDHMVLQQDRTIPVWGTAAPGEMVAVSLGKDHAKAKADASGKWRVDLKAVPWSGVGTTLIVKGTNTVTFSDVLVGDVWLASGQSNMEYGIAGADTGPRAIAAANNPMIRLFIVPRATAAYPQTEIATPADAWHGRWEVCTPETLGQGATWAGFSAVAYFFGRDIQKFTGRPVGLIADSYGGSPAQAWVSFEGLQKDPILDPFVQAHRKLLAGYDAAMASLPGDMAAWKAKDEEWQRVSKPANAEAQKKWQEDAAAAAAAGKPAPPQPHLVNEPQMPDPTGGHGHPSALYNGMIVPILPYAIKGVIWYQGESNNGIGPIYRTMFARLIQDWRERWGEGDFPFIFVQLPNFNYKWSPMRESQLKTLAVPNTGMVVTIDVGGEHSLHPLYKEVVGGRMALVAEHVAYGKDLVYEGPLYKGMVVEGNSIRVSFNDVGSGLTIGTTPVHGADVTVAPTDKLMSFTIAGEDRVFHPAEAKIDGDTVVVTSAEVAHPVAVRYGWEPPTTCNLYNKEMLPASPFRTDDWDDARR
jgi:sialate O-acetylesterase